MQDLTPQQIKTLALEKLGRIIPRQAEQLRAIDARLLDYYEGLQDARLHNLDEILGGLAMLRKLRAYPFKQKKVTHAIRLYEGIWRNGEYQEGSGGLQFSGLKGFTHYQLQPFQVFALAGLLGPHHDVDGDTRRLCTELVLYLTRKSGKTLMSAFIQFYGFFFMDANFEGYCCANSADQAKLLYKTAQQLIRQMDPTERRIRFTASQTNWKVGQPRQASITALSAGGKTKDGLFAQLCCADEFGSADFTNGKSDMKDLVSVVQSSMGPRREPLTVISTTAGYAVNGPFRQQLDIMHQSLLQELDLPDDATDRLPSDYQHALLLQPDEWEQQDEELLLSDPNIWRKANPMIGISVQPSFYEQEAYKARQNPDNRKEFITKLVNVYQRGRVTEWIKADKIRTLQRKGSINDCTYDQGWRVFVGMDFSSGQDLFAITYLAVNYSPGRTSMRGLMFADTEAWVLEEELKQSPNRALYETWIAEGWLKVCPGEVFDSMLAMSALASHLFYPKEDGTPDLQRMRLDIVGFGYDPAQSKSPINNLQAWLQSLGIQNEAIKQMVIPVSQSAMCMNPIVGHLEEMILAPEPWVEFSESPLWPWCFGNCGVELGRTDLRRIVKGGTLSGKIDPVAALLDATYLFDLSEGRIEKER